MDPIQDAKTGQFFCPKCKSPLIKNRVGAGYHCGKPGNVWQPHKKAWSLCDYSHFPKKTPFVKKDPEISRAENYPRPKTPTPQQIDIVNLTSQPPSKRGFTSMVFDAGAGCGKTSTGAMALEGIIQRVRATAMKVAVFNRNAKFSFMEKTPEEVDVNTLNGLGARLQCYKFKQYKPRKLHKIFEDMVSNFAYDDRPSIRPINKIIEAMRDLLLFNPNPNDKTWWDEAIVRTVMRCPAVNKHYTTNSKTVHSYLPQVFVQSHQIADTIDIQEQWSRPITDAISRLKFQLPWHLTERDAKWTDEEVNLLAKLVKEVRLPHYHLFVDEAQDLSLAQIVFALAISHTKELYFVGDDEVGTYGTDNYKCGQTIYAWRRAFGGGMNLMERVRTVLDGKCVRKPLTVTFRCPQEIVKGLYQLNTSLESRKPGGILREVEWNDAFQVWCKTEKGAYWITRTNKECAHVMLQTLRARKSCSLRGTDMSETFDGVLYSCAGWRDDDGEYKVSLNGAIERLKEIVGEAADTPTGQVQEDCPEAFILAILEAVRDDTGILKQGGVNSSVPTVGNVKRLLDCLVNSDSNRCVTNVYRIKGEEQPLVIVSDTEQFNKAWNEDVREARSCRFVAVTRASEVCLIAGHLNDVNPTSTGPATDDGNVQASTPIVQKAKKGQKVEKPKPVKVEKPKPEPKKAPEPKEEPKNLLAKKSSKLCNKAVQHANKLPLTSLRSMLVDVMAILDGDDEEAKHLRKRYYKDWEDEELEDLRDAIEARLG